MKNYIYQNTIISTKELRRLLAWSFTKYDSMQACRLADELKYLGFKYATKAGISISIEDLKVPFCKKLMLKKSNYDVLNTEKLYSKGKITEFEKLQKIIDSWSFNSEYLKKEVVYYFKNYDPLNSIYIMAFSGARGNISQVRQLVGMRGLMSDPNGEILKLPIKKNFREGLTITDYIISGYGARKGIVDTALKTANSGYLTRRLIDVAQDILTREKDCLTNQSILLKFSLDSDYELILNKVFGYVVNKPIFTTTNHQLIADINQKVDQKLIELLQKNKIQYCYIRSPLTCTLYRSICQKCYGYDLATEELIDLGETVGIIAGQSIGEPGTQLTMRTFHTGGIFTTKTIQQIFSPVEGIIKFSKFLKTQIIRTNRGENVLLTNNSGSLIIFTTKNLTNFVKIEVFSNMLLFIKNNEYIKQYDLIGELINKNKQIKKEIKQVVTTSSGEIIIPKIKNKINLINNNKILWLLAGELYSAPLKSFINFYNDHIINENSFIFRTKILSPTSGKVKFRNNIGNLFERVIQIKNTDYFFNNSSLKKLKNSNNKIILKIDDSFFFFKCNILNNNLYFPLKLKKSFGNLIDNKFKTSTGGHLYYDLNSVKTSYKFTKTITYLVPIKFHNFIAKKSITYKTFVWLPLEMYKINSSKNLIYPENNSFIHSFTKITNTVYSKNSGFLTIKKKNLNNQFITIKVGTIFHQNYHTKYNKKIFYPGEIINNSIFIFKLSYCEYLLSFNKNRLLIRPLQIFEIPNKNKNINLDLNQKTNLIFNNITHYVYKAGQTIKTSKNTILILNFLTINLKDILNKQNNLVLKNNHFTKCVNIEIVKTLNLNNYVNPHLKYKKIQSCLMVEKKQYVDFYSLLGYLEIKTTTLFRIVSIKYKYNFIKQIYLILNNHCEVIPQNNAIKIKNNNFIFDHKNLKKIGRIITKNKKKIIIQKGKLYFFPNCQNDNVIDKTNLQYKFLKLQKLSNLKDISTSRRIAIKYYDISKKLIKQKPKLINSNLVNTSLTLEFTKLFLKKNKKFYSSSIPRFFQQFSINNPKNKKSIINKLIRQNNKIYPYKKKKEQTLLIQNSKIKRKRFKNADRNLISIKFLEHPFTKSISLHSLSENFLKQEFNKVYCTHGQFIEQGEIIGLLNFEKEITGDIVQGLPRIEELLEARKNKSLLKTNSINEKKNLLVEQTNLDINFDFKKIGTIIKKNEKINPHNLLKIYFNYYGLIKILLATNTKKAVFLRLLNNYDGSYKTFKKIQSLILNSVQSVYKSQGVVIADKHLEVIIKQMTTKVLVSYEGHTPLLPKEVIDLYHIKYINETITYFNKIPAYYVPLLLGITKAALNNPSFISAASFQETTRILTKCALEGRIDWLRGLKENIITGHLIPAGTGYQNYQETFKA